MKSIDEKFKRKASVGIELIEEAVIEAIRKYPAPHYKCSTTKHTIEIARMVGIEHRICSLIAESLEVQGKLKKRSERTGWVVNEDG